MEDQAPQVSSTVFGSRIAPDVCSAQEEVVRREFRRPSLPKEELSAQRAALVASKVPP